MPSKKTHKQALTGFQLADHGLLRIHIGGAAQQKALGQVFLEKGLEHVLACRGGSLHRYFLSGEETYRALAARGKGGGDLE